MSKFFAGKLKALGGDPGASQLLRFGASRDINDVSHESGDSTHIHYQDSQRKSVQKPFT